MVNPDTCRTMTAVSFTNKNVHQLTYTEQKVTHDSEAYKSVRPHPQYET
jgi:hypothetical protein